MGDAMFLKYFSIFLISMVPLIELRGAIPIAMGMGLDTIPSIIICAIGNMLPVPIIYLFAHRFLLWGLDKPVIGPVCRFFHEKGEKEYNEVCLNNCYYLETNTKPQLFLGTISA